VIAWREYILHGKGVRYVYTKGAMGGCYVDINNVYLKGRVNGYQIVPIDGYDIPRIKCHRTNISLFW
jgi:hypothetical protein